jgi:methyl-accepting chemotaxis protein-2 (aspartate sensor receptor)
MTATEVFHAAMVNEAGSFARLFAAEFAGPFALDPDDTVAVAGKATPRLSNGGKVLNLDTATVDRYLRKRAWWPPFSPPMAMNSCASAPR